MTSKQFCLTLNVYVITIRETNGKQVAQCTEFTFTIQSVLFRQWWAEPPPSASNGSELRTGQRVEWTNGRVRTRGHAARHTSTKPTSRNISGTRLYPTRKTVIPQYSQTPECKHYVKKQGGMFWLLWFSIQVYNRRTLPVSICRVQHMKLLKRFQWHVVFMIQLHREGISGSQRSNMKLKFNTIGSLKICSSYTTVCLI